MTDTSKVLLPVRTSSRLRQRNYSAPGAYFVTLLSYHREPIFSEIQEARVHLLDVGRIVQDEWLKTPLIRPYVSVDSELLVCMPDHIHGVIWILNEHGERILSASADANTVRSTGYQPQSIGSIVSHIKAQVTRRVREQLGLPSLKIWHRNYHESVIRNSTHLANITRYIQNNPSRWHQRL